MRTNTIAALILVLTASATTLPAQSARRDTPDRTRPAGAERARVQGSPAAALLRQSERLALTADQVRQLTQLAETQRGASRTEPAQRLRLRADMLDARASGNTAALRASLDKASAARNARIVAMMEERKKARAVLTNEQRATLESQRGDRVRGMQGKASRNAQMRGARGPQRRDAATPARPPRRDN